MKKQTAFFIAAIVVSIPAWLLLLNLVAFAITGKGFLIDGDSAVNSARIFVAWAFASLALMLAVMGI